MTESPVREHTSSDNGAATGHDERGRFTKGTPGGPVNPFGRKVAALRAALIDCITPQDIQRVMAALLLEAVNGNLAAARLLLAYTVGKPADPANPDRVDVDEWQLLRQTVAPQNEVARTFQSVPVELASQLATATLPVLTDEMGDQLAARLMAPVAGPSTPARKKRRPHQEKISAAPSPNGMRQPESPHTPGATAAAARQLTAWTAQRHRQLTA